MNRTAVLAAAAIMLTATACGGDPGTEADPSPDSRPAAPETAEAAVEAETPGPDTPEAAPVPEPSVRTYADMTSSEVLTVKCADVIEGELTNRTQDLMADFIANPSGATLDQVELAALRFEWGLIAMGAPAQLAQDVDGIVLPLEQLSDAFAGGGNSTIETQQQQFHILEVEIACSIPISEDDPEAAPADEPSSAGCLPAPADLVAQIEQVLEPGQYLAATAAVEAPDGTLYLGGDIMREQDDARVSSQDTWAYVDDGLYAVSGSAVEYSSLADGRDVLGVSAGDEYGTALQQCIGAARS